MNPGLTAKIRELIGADTTPASDELLARLAETVRDVREHEHAADDIYCANLKGWMGERTGVLLARLLHAAAIITRQHALIAEAADRVHPCPVPNIAAGLDLCPHGSSWPCAETTLAWRLRGLDPAAAQAQILSVVRAEMANAAPDAHDPDDDETADGAS